MNRTDSHRSRNGRKSWGNWKDSQNVKDSGRSSSNSGSNGRGYNRGRNFKNNNVVSSHEIAAQENAIREYKANVFICSECGQPITDMYMAMADKADGNPMHFDCVLNILSKREHLQDGEKLIYIGQGRFGVVYFENVHDYRHFTIRRIVEWEEHDKKYDWRNEIAELYSHVK